MPIFNMVGSGGGKAEEEKTVSAPDFSAGNVEVTPTEGKTMSKVTLTKDADLTAGNIKKDVAIFGVTGSYEGEESTGDFLVRFIDYDGTVLKEEWVNSGNNATPPSPPDHSADCSGGGLTFVEWNNSYTNVTHDMIIGASYETTDDKTHALIKLAAATGKDVALYMKKSGSSSLYVDWGDSSDYSVFTNNGVFNTETHTYEDYGDYEIKIWMVGGTDTYSFGNAGTPTAFINTAEKRYILKKLFIGERAKGLEAGGLASSISLQAISLSPTMGAFGSSAFYTCKSLKCVVFPRNTASISFGTLFYYCQTIIYISFPASISAFSPGQYTFNACYNLKSVVLPSGVTSMQTYSFQYCHSLETIYFPSGFLSIGSNSFEQCRTLKSISLPSGFTTLSSGAFLDCNALEEVILPNSLTTIEGSAFRNCFSLKSITIPNSITSITGETILYYCYSLSSITFSNQQTWIPASFLTNCYSLTSLVLPASAGVVKASAFTNCENILLYDFTARTSVPYLENISAFNQINKSCIIQVPASLETDWKSATNWVTLAAHIVGV